MNMINNTSYISLCKHKYDPTQGREYIPPSGLVHVPLDHIAPFFKKIADKEENSYVVVSSNSDLSLCLQAEHTMKENMARWFEFAKGDWIVDDSLSGYEPVYLHPRCVPGAAKRSDKYCVKTYSYTYATFDEIPKSVKHWFVVNNDLEEEKVTSLPFGVPSWTEELIVAKKVVLQPKRDERIYVNFQSNTIERSKVKSFLLAGNLDNRFFIEPDPVDHQTYVDRLFQFKYVLCLEGNGFDTYRGLEAIYSGAIPIFPNRRYLHHYNGLFFNTMEDLFGGSFTHSARQEILTLDDFSSSLARVSHGLY